MVVLAPRTTPADVYVFAVVPAVATIALGWAGAGGVAIVHPVITRHVCANGWIMFRVIHDCSSVFGGSLTPHNQSNTVYTVCVRFFCTMCVFFENRGGGVHSKLFGPVLRASYLPPWCCRLLLAELLGVIAIWAVFLGFFQGFSADFWRVCTYFWRVYP